MNNSPLSRMELMILGELQQAQKTAKRGTRPIYNAALVTTHNISHGKGRYYACHNLVERGLAEYVSKSSKGPEKTVEVQLTKTGLKFDLGGEVALRRVTPRVRATTPPPKQVEPNWEFIVHEYARRSGGTPDQIADKAGLPSSTVRAFLGNNAILSFRQGSRVAAALGFQLVGPGIAGGKEKRKVPNSVTGPKRAATKKKTKGKK